MDLITLYDRQKKLNLNLKQSLTIAGCGGVGAWVAIYAAMSGIEKLVLFDNDVWDMSNLNRVPFPEKYLGMNKAKTTQRYIQTLRPDCDVKSFHFVLQEFAFTKTNWLVDCTDVYKAQKFHQNLAKKHGVRYMKVGYDGFHISIHNKVAEWGKELDGYTVVPSWVVPAATVAALAVAKIVKFDTKEVSCGIQDLFRSR